MTKGKVYAIILYGCYSADGVRPSRENLCRRDRYMMTALIVFSVVVFLVVAGIAVFAILDIKGVNIKFPHRKKKDVKGKKTSSKVNAKKKPSKDIKAVRAADEREEKMQAEREREEKMLAGAEAQEVAKEQPSPAEESAPQPATAAEDVAPEKQDTEIGDNISDDEDVAIKAVTDHGKTRYIVIKYSKSFLAKLIQSDDETKRYYSEIKNKLLSYKGVKCRLSWRWETFRSGRTVLAKLRLRGKSLSLALPLNAAQYADTKYIVEDFSSVKSFAETPCVYRIKNDRRLKYSADLIAEVMAKYGLAENPAAESVDYASRCPYESTQALLARKLIKELTDEEAQSGTMFAPRKSVTAAEADTLIGDEQAKALIMQAEEDVPHPVAKGGKAEIVNIDTLSRYFADGEVVTLEEIKKRVPDIGRKVTAVKVLARGTLDKSLTVYADAFSLQAVKMIVLTGGKAVKI